MESILGPLAEQLVEVVGGTLRDLHALFLELMNEIAPEVLQAVALAVNDILPVLGTACKGVKAVASLGGAVITKVRAFEAWHRAREAVQEGDATDALNAVYNLENRKFYAQVRAAHRDSASFIANLITDTAIVGDFGASTAIVRPIVAVANAILSLCDVLYKLGRSIFEALRGNLALLRGDYEGLFGACPILGSYYLATANDSAILRFDVREKDWMKEVEKRKKKVSQKSNPLGRDALTLARMQVYEFPFELLYYGSSEPMMRQLKGINATKALQFVLLPSWTLKSCIREYGKGHITFKAKTYVPLAKRLRGGFMKKVTGMLKKKKSEEELKKWKGLSSSELASGGEQQEDGSFKLELTASDLDEARPLKRTKASRDLKALLASE